jgi:DNA-binding Lrp family transcriptional regulator
MDSPILDHTDFAIIRILQKNAWTPNKQIAAAVRLAPSTCHERIRHLRASGVIRTAHAEIEPRAIGVGLEALAFIKLAKYERAVINRFLSEMESIPEVQSVFLVNGRHDVILHIAVKDVDHLRNLGLDRITSQPVVVNIETSIVYDSRSRNQLPVLLDEADKRQGKAMQQRKYSRSAKNVRGHSPHLRRR